MKRSNSNNLKISLAIFVVLGLFTTMSAQRLDKAKLDQFFDRLAKNNKAMGSLVLARGGRVVHQRTIGYGQLSDAEKKPLSPASKFRIGSVTKMFTAALIMQLVDEKKLKLTDTLDKFFPQVPNAQKITIAQILSHRSGIHDSLIDPKMRTPSARLTGASKEELLAIVAKSTPDFEPDTQHQYSNSGYFLLGLVIEKVTGRSYEANLEKRITSKLGLKDTFAATGNIDPSKNEALSYTYFNEWKAVPETHPSNLFGAGTIVSTPFDLVKFIQALFDGKIVSKESLALMKTTRDGEGMGMEPFTFDGKTFYGHTGGVDNFGAWLAYEPEERVALAYTSNAKVYPVKDIVSGVADIYYGKPFQVPTFESFAVAQEILDKYVGVYSVPGAPAKITITREGTTLLFQPPGSSPVPLEATAVDKFKIDNGTSAGIVIEFDAVKNTVTVKRNGGERVLTKEK
jgi:D-alanyl-D-alanine carboxypeptidase